MGKALSIDQLYKKKFDVFEFEGEWKASFGQPETNGVWLVYGLSGHGKTSFNMQLARNLCSYKRVQYNTLEEGARKSFRDAMERNHMHLAKHRFSINSEDYNELLKRVENRKGHRIIIVDSIQYLGITKTEYRKLKSLALQFKKLIIFVSHARGRKPLGALAEFVEYDADVKIRVEGFTAFIKSRYGGGQDYIIWPEGAAKYWQKLKATGDE